MLCIEDTRGHDQTLNTSQYVATMSLSVDYVDFASCLVRQPALLLRVSGNDACLNTWYSCGELSEDRVC